MFKQLLGLKKLQWPAQSSDRNTQTNVQTTKNPTPVPTHTNASQWMGIK